MNKERLTHLKIKIKHLAAEATIIRQETKKTSGMAKWRLNEHRTEVVRPYARLNLLAYSCLREMPYSKIEQKCLEVPDWDDIFIIAKRFGGTEEEIDSWTREAKAYLKRRDK